MKARIGIDPGKSGAFVIQKDNQVIVHAMPLIAKEYDIQGMKKILEDYICMEGDGNDIMIVLEDVHAIFNSSAGSTFEFGRGLGIIEGIISSFDIPHVKIAPKTWQKICFQGVPVIEKPGTKAKGAARYDNKAMALLAVKRLYPNQKLTFTDKQTKPQDGLIDALLLSHYCKLNY